MNIRKPISRNELEQCVDIYLAMNDESFLPSDKFNAFSNILRRWRGGEFIRIIEKDNEVVGFITGLVHVLPHCKYKQIDQDYYVSNLKGFGAARAVIVAHEEMIKYAEETGIPFVVTHCSHEDEDRVLCKILQKKGWRVKGHVALWRTSHAPKP